MISLQDMGIEEPEFVDLVNQIEKLEQQLLSHPLNKVWATMCSCLKLQFFFQIKFQLTLRNMICFFQSQDENQMKCFQRKAEVSHEIQQLKTKMRDSQVIICLSACR